MDSLLLLILSSFGGIFFGFAFVYLFKIINNRRMIKKAEESLGIERIKEEIVHETPVIEEKPQNLKPCWVCGNMSTGDVCSIAHQQEWIRLNNIQLNEGNDHPNKGGEAHSISESHDSAPPSKSNNGDK